MSVPEQNIKTMMQWLGDPQVISASPKAEDITEDLAELVFLGDAEWLNYQDRAARYATDISAWLGDDESQFITLTAENADPPAFITWMDSVLPRWKAEASKDEAGHQGQGLPNPNHSTDPTPGTQFYKYDAPSETYLYSATAAGSDGWATYEQRRYSEATWDENYGLRYRYDKRDEVYQWYDEDNGTWNSQDWADQYAARHASQAAAAAAPGAEPQAVSAAEWDENWQMFYRIGPGGAYQYADAVIPGNASSGSSEVWLSYEQVMTRATPEQAGPEPGGEQEAQKAAINPSPEEVDAFSNQLLQEHPEFAEIPEERRQQIMAEVLDELRAS